LRSRATRSAHREARFGVAIRQLKQGGNLAWTGKDIEFSLKAEGNDTALHFAHRGFKQNDEEYAGATTRWGFYLVGLKRYLETGKGSPNPDDSEGFG